MPVGSPARSVRANHRVMVRDRPFGPPRCCTSRPARGLGSVREALVAVPGADLLFSHVRSIVRDRRDAVARLVCDAALDRPIVMRFPRGTLVLAPGAGCIRAQAARRPATSPPRPLPPICGPARGAKAACLRDAASTRRRSPHPRRTRGCLHRPWQASRSTREAPCPMGCTSWPRPRTQIQDVAWRRAAFRPR